MRMIGGKKGRYRSARGRGGGVALRRGVSIRSWRRRWRYIRMELERRGRRRSVRSWMGGGEGSVRARVRLQMVRWAAERGR